MRRLDARAALPASVRAPRFAPEALGVGIVHLGIGAFHRAHQSVYTDDALESSGGDWRTIGVSLRGRAAADALNPQDGRYTLLTRGGAGPRVIGNIAGVRHAPSEAERVLRHLADPATRIVSLTITEKGYGLDSRTGGLHRSHPEVAADIADPAGAPRSALGFIVRALALRKAAGAGPLTVLSCDNLPGNGAVTRRLVREMADIVAPAVADWIEDAVRFPSTMVDRITPAPTAATLAEAAAAIGFEDQAAVETEAFSQWVVEDEFAAGRPEWEAGGATFVEDVRPYEDMKLRMLNGSHSMLATSGFLLGLAHVRDVMADGALKRLIARHLSAAAGTLAPDLAVDLPAYGAALLDRFANPAIAHATAQIVMDGTQKLPPRVFAAALVAERRGQPLDAFAFATAAWMRYAIGRKDDGTAYALNDPRAAEIERAVRQTSDAEALYGALSGLPGFMPAELASLPAWRNAVTMRLQTMLASSMRAAVAREAMPGQSGG